MNIMGKFYLNESQFNQLVAKCVKKALNEDATGEEQYHQAEQLVRQAIELLEYPMTSGQGYSKSQDDIFQEVWDAMHDICY